VKDLPAFLKCYHSVPALYYAEQNNNFYFDCYIEAFFKCAGYSIKEAEKIVKKLKSTVIDKNLLLLKTKKGSLQYKKKRRSSSRKNKD